MGNRPLTEGARNILPCSPPLSYFVLVNPEPGRGSLVRKAQEFTGVTERTALLREALKALIHLEASRRLAAVGGTEPDLEDIKRVRADNL